MTTEIWYVRRQEGEAFQVARLSWAELLQNHRSDVLRDTDLIRKSGDKEWRRRDEYDWPLDTSASNVDAPILTEQISYELRGNATLAECSPLKTTPLPQVESTAEWWSPAVVTPISPTAIRLWLLTISMFGSGLLIGSITTYLGLLELGYRAATAPDQATMAMSASNQPSAIDSSVGSKAEESPTSAALNAQSLVDQAVDSSAFESKPVVLEQQESVQLLSQSQPHVTTEPAPSTRDLTSASVEPTSAKNSEISPQVGTDQPSPLKVSDLIVKSVPDQAYQSTASIQDAKSEVDRLFDLTAALIESHIKNFGELQTSLTTWQELTLTTQKELREKGRILALKLQCEAEIIEAQAAHRDAVGLANRVKDKAIAQAYRQRAIEAQNAINGLGRQIAIYQKLYDGLNDSLVVNNSKLRSTINEIRRAAGNQSHALVSIIDEIDLFGEYPLAYHRRVADFTKEKLHEHPGLLIGYLLHAAACVADENYSDVKTDLERLQTQIGLAPPILQPAILFNLESLGLSLLALAESRAGSHDQAVRQINKVMQGNGKFAIGWLLSGYINTKAGKYSKGIDDVKKGVRELPDNVRCHRVAICIMLDMPQPQPLLLSTYTQALESKASGEDWRSWCVVAAAHRLLNNPQAAQEAIDRIDPKYRDLPEFAELDKRLALAASGNRATSKSNDLEP